MEQEPVFDTRIGKQECGVLYLPQMFQHTRHIKVEHQKCLIILSGEPVTLAPVDIGLGYI